MDVLNGKGLFRLLRFSRYEFVLELLSVSDEENEDEEASAMHRAPFRTGTHTAKVKEVKPYT